MTEAFKFRQFSKFQLALNGDSVKEFDKFSSAVGFAAAHYHLASGQTSKLATTGAVSIEDDLVLTIKGRK